MINTIKEKQQKAKEYIEKIEKSTYFCIESCFGETDILKSTVFKIIEKNEERGTYIITDGEKKAEVKKYMLFNHVTNDIRSNYVNLKKETEKSIEENFKEWKKSVFQETLSVIVMGVLLAIFVTMFTRSLYSFDLAFPLIVGAIVFISIGVLCLVDKVKIKKMEKIFYENYQRFIQHIDADEDIEKYNFKNLKFVPKRVEVKKVMNTEKKKKNQNLYNINSK